MRHEKRLLIENACYHLITRGNQKQVVFRCEEDYAMYLFLLKKFKKKYKFKVYAYCLMPNHVHILGEIENQPMLSNFMHDLNRTYTLYFNKTYQKVGHLWQGRYKSMAITKDKYLLDCLSYIEMNPMRADVAKQPNLYLWSSYNARALGKEDTITDKLFLI